MHRTGRLVGLKYQYYTQVTAVDSRCYSSKKRLRQTSRAPSLRRSGKISQHTRLGPEGVLMLARRAVGAKDRRGTVCCLRSHVELAQSINVRGDLLFIC